MPVAIGPPSRPVQEPAPALDDIRVRLEQRLLTALESWDLEKKRLEEAVARAEEKEREFRETADDVKRRLEAVELVAAMAREMVSEAPAEEPPQPALAQEKPGPNLSLNAAPGPQASSRPLFSREIRAGLFSMLR
jgi:hypothetical protein